MTIKEITTLRKSGHLQEALTAAEDEFERNSNKYTAGAVFWCLYSLLKQQSGDDAVATRDRILSLYNNFCQDDEVIRKIIPSVEQRMDPHYQEINDAVEKAKGGGRVLADYQNVSKWYSDGTLGPQLYQGFGWLTYYALKQTVPGDVQSRKIMLNQYLKLELPRPSILHSLILGEAVKVEHATPLQFRIRDFIRMWGLENLRDADWEQFQTEDGNTLPSLVEKLIGVYAKELKTDGVVAPEDFSILVDKALMKFPKNQNMPYFKATVLLSQGNVEEALNYYKDMILQFPSKFYLWNQISELIEDVDVKIGCLCKAITCGADDEFLGGVRLKLASILCQKGLRENAKHELDKYKETYQKKGWNCKPNCSKLYNQLSSVIASSDNNALYAEFAVKADEFIYSSLPTRLAVKLSESQTEDRNHSNRKITIWLLRVGKDTLRLRKPTKFGLNRRTSNGAVFDVKLHCGKIVWIKPHAGCVNEPWIKEMSGKVSLRTDRNGKKYAIISGAYVGENLLKGINDGQLIKILSVQQKDERWTAVNILT